jgi:uncharacterized repeat protein (TIGR02543 family)
MNTIKLLTGLGKDVEAKKLSIITTEQEMTFILNGYDNSPFITTELYLMDAGASIDFENMYQLTITVNAGGQIITGVSGDYAPDTVIDLVISTDDGYLFTGWLSSNGGLFSDSSNVKTTFTMPANDVEITANWKKIDDIIDVTIYDITYNGNGHTNGIVPIDDNSPYDEGIQVVVLGQSSMVKAGYSFLGWSPSSSAAAATFTAGSTFYIYDDVTLYAVWSRDVYTVTYSPGDHGTFTVQTTNDLSYGDQTPVAPTVTGEVGWNFIGWSPTPAATVTSNATYVAQWIQIATPTPPPTLSPIPTSSASPSPTASPSPSATITPSPSPLPTASSIPTASPPIDGGDDSSQVWSFANLTLSIVGVVLAIIVVLYVLLQKRQNDMRGQSQENFGGKQQNVKSQYTSGQYDSQVDEKKQTRYRYIWLITSLVMGITGIVVFFLTEDMSLQMTIVSKWTSVNTIIFLLELIALFFTFKHKKTSTNTVQKKPNTTST